MGAPKKVTVGKKPTAVSNYKAPVNNVGTYTAPTYESQYGAQLDQALNTVTNWNYNPLEDASYKALASLYESKGNRAAKNTLGDAASLNGGYGTSYAVSAAQQARNDYNEQLAAMIPELEDRAYSRATGTLSALREAETFNYNKYRDSVSDSQWNYTNKYNQYRDLVSDSQWAWTQKYNKYRDAMSDYQWALDYNLGVYTAKKSKSSGGGGSSGGRSSGAGYSGTSSSASDFETAAWNSASKNTNKNSSSGKGSGKNTNKNKNKNSGKSNQKKSLGQYASNSW